MATNGAEVSTIAKVLLLDHDTETIFGTASGRAISPPEKEVMAGTFSITFGNMLEALLPELDEGCEIDEERPCSISIVGGKIRIEFSVVGNRVLSSSGATYEHFRMV
jgi:hypothetical protein